MSHCQTLHIHGLLVHSSLLVCFCKKSTLCIIELTTWVCTVSYDDSSTGGACVLFTLCTILEIIDGREKVGIIFLYCLVMLQLSLLVDVPSIHGKSVRCVSGGVFHLGTTLSSGDRNVMNSYWLPVSKLEAQVFGRAYKTNRTSNHFRLCAGFGQAHEQQESGM